MSTKDKSQGSNGLTILAEKLQNLVFYDLAGPRVLAFRYILNVFKGATFLWVMFLMHYFQNYSTAMYLYLFLHGSYGICWVVKDLWFPDWRFLQKASLGSNVALVVFLLCYWMISVPLAAGYGVSDPSPARMVFLVVIYLVGLVLMMGSDYQKTTTLAVRKGLISDGFFKYSRNPNYLGEILIYSSFVLCAGHVVGFVVFYGLGGLLFAINIYLKDKLSYEKKAGWEQYSRDSYILLPKIFATFLLNAVFYLCLLIALVYFLAQETPETFLYPFVSSKQ